LEKVFEVNRAYCSSIGDHSQLSWDKSPEWQKLSAINGVKYHIANPGSKPSDSHDNWLKEKVADGWKYGKAKSPELKLHPCIVPYENLPEEQKTKDKLFLSVVRAFMN
jgi:hypothetical protein